MSAKERIHLCKRFCTYQQLHVGLAQPAFAIVFVVVKQVASTRLILIACCETLKTRQRRSDDVKSCIDVG